MNFFRVSVDGVNGDSVSVSSNDLAPTAIHVRSQTLKAGDTATLGVRPHALRQATSGGVVGRVALVERLGNETNISVTLPSGTMLMAVLDGDRALHPGESIVLDFAASDSLLFDGDGRAL